MRKMATIASFSVQFINQLTWHGEKPKKRKPILNCLNNAATLLQTNCFKYTRIWMTNEFAKKFIFSVSIKVVNPLCFCMHISHVNECAHHHVIRTLKVALKFEQNQDLDRKFVRIINSSNEMQNFISMSFQ